MCPLVHIFLTIFIHVKTFYVLYCQLWPQEFGIAWVRNLVFVYYYEHFNHNLFQEFKPVFHFHAMMIYFEMKCYLFCQLFQAV